MARRALEVHVAAATRAAVRNHGSVFRKGEVSDQATLLVEDEGADRNLELQVGTGAPGLAPAGPVRTRLCAPVRSLLVEREVSELGGRLQRDRATAPAVAAIRAAVGDEGLAAERGRAATAIPGTQDYSRRIDERPPLGFASC